MNDLKVTKSQLICNILCAIVWTMNVVLRINKHPDDLAGIVIWSIGAILWIILAVLNYHRYKKQINQ